MEKFELNLVWQTRRDSVDIILTCVTAFRLEKKLM